LATAQRLVRFQYQSIPLAGGDTELIMITSEEQKEFGQEINRLDCYSTVLDYIIDLDNKEGTDDNEKKGMPMKYSYFDIRDINLQRNIKFLTGKKMENMCHKEDADTDFNINDLSKFLSDIH